MGWWFPCFGSTENVKNHHLGGKKKKKKEFERLLSNSSTEWDDIISDSKEIIIPSSPPIIDCQSFTFQELDVATKNIFPQFTRLAEGRYGHVYKGVFENGHNTQVIAMKHLANNDENKKKNKKKLLIDGNKNFLMDVHKLSLLHHPNIVNLIGYCNEGDHRFLVYDFLPSLEYHLHDFSTDKKVLDWKTRMKIADGVAKGLAYLHSVQPPVFYGNFKSSDILLDDGFNPKLVGASSNGCSAPKYAKTGPTVRSDLYCFGVFLLELITGRKAFDNSLAQGEHDLVAWAKPFLSEVKYFPRIADPLLRGRYPDYDYDIAIHILITCISTVGSRLNLESILPVLNGLAAA